MKKKNRFDELPDEIIKKIGTLLPLEDKLAFFSTSKRHRGLLRDNVYAIKSLKTHIVKSDRAKVEEVLKENPEVLREAIRLTDPSKHQFKPITAFRFALWAYDIRMLRTILKSLPNTAEGEALRLELLQQFETHMKEGVEYTFKKLYNVILGQPPTNEAGEGIAADIIKDALYIEDREQNLNYTVYRQGKNGLIRESGELSKASLGINETIEVTLELLKEKKQQILIMTSKSGHTPLEETRREIFYDWAIISSLQNYCDEENYNRRDICECIQNWCMGFGMDERYAPIHVISEICQKNRVFSGDLKFDEVELPLDTTFYNYSPGRNGELDDWLTVCDSNSGGPGVDFAVYGLGRGRGVMVAGAEVARLGRRNLAGLTAVCEARIADIAKFKAELEEPIHASQNRP